MGKPLRVLIVGDVENDAVLVVPELRKGGFEVAFERVDTPETMAGALERGAWDVVVSDVRMPRFSAPAALALCQARGLDIPFIVVSGTIGEEQAVELMKAGAHDFFLKWRLERLCAAVERELREAEVRRSRRQAEQEVARQQQLFRERYTRASEVAKVGVWDLDVVTNEMYLEPRLKALLGFGDSEVPNRFDDWVKRVHPDDVEEVQRLVRAHADGKTPRLEVERRMLHKDGSVRWFLCRGQAVRDGTGKSVRMVGTEMDVTDRHRLEGQLRQSQKMEAVGRLAGGIAHDFNNLLGVITGYSELLLQELGDEHPARPRAQEVLKAAERAASLTRQLLAFSRKQTLRPSVLDVNEVVSGIEPMLRRVIGEDVELAVVLGKALRRVKVDAGQLEQVVMNLVVNARDAMPRGGRLVVETGEAELDQAYVWAHPDVRLGPHVVLTVSDTGHGMAPETLAHVFEPFFTTKEAGQGTGLGLSTVQGIVSQSGGHVSVYSEVGYGTTFKVYLPVTATEAGAAEAAELTSAASGPAPGGSDVILVVEDDEALRRMTRQVLSAAGYTAVEATGIEEAEAAMRRGGRIDLLLTDVVMPGCGGREVAERLRLLQPGLEVLYMSGYTSEALGRHGIVETGVHLVQKPFTSDSLLRAVRTALGEPTGPAKVWEAGDPVVPARPLARAPTSIPETSETILLVDDDESVRTLTRTMLAGIGYRVLVASDPENALEIARDSAQPIHLLMTDMLMPRIDGPTLAREITAERPDLTVLFTSGDSEGAMLREAGLAGRTLFLPKPFTLASLTRKVREALDRRKQ